MPWTLFVVVLGALWSQRPLPAQLLVQQEAATYAETVTQHTLAGLLAYEAGAAQHPGPMLWIEGGSPAYGRWLAAFSQRTGITPTPVDGDVWDLVSTMAKAGVVRGYVLFQAPKRAAASGHRLHAAEHPSQAGAEAWSLESETFMAADNSVNIATSLCARLHGVAVAEEDTGRVAAMGLPLLADARHLTYGELLAASTAPFNPNVLAVLAPGQAHLRDLVVAEGALVTLNTRLGGYDEALRHLVPGGSVFGWGQDVEFSFTDAASRVGAGVVAADWASNLSVLSSGTTGLNRTPAPRTTPLAPVPADDDLDARYIAFIMSDGDNLQWVERDYTTNPMWYAAPQRGQVPMGWGVPVSTTLELTPDIWDYFAQTVTANDDLIAFGDSYAYVDHMGGRHAVETFYGRRAPYWDFAQVHQALVFASDWDSVAAREAYGHIATAVPSLEGLFVLQYLPYADGKGHILWAKRPTGDDVPVLTALRTVRNDFDDGSCGTPQEVLDVIHAWARQPITKPEDRFTWVSVLAWSAYPLPADAPDLADGNGRLGPYQAAAYMQRHLDANVRVVSPSALVTLLRQAH